MAQPTQGVAQGVAHPPVVEEDHAPQGGEAAHPPAVEVVQPPRANPPVVEVPPSVIVNNPSAINKDELIRFLEAQNRQLISEIQKLSSENKVAKNANYYLKIKCSNLDQTLKDFKSEVTNLKKDYNIFDNISSVLNQCAPEVPAELFKTTAKRARGGRDKQYTP